MAGKVTDPELLAQLESAPSAKVVDPSVIAQLEAEPETEGIGRRIARYIGETGAGLVTGASRIATAADPALAALGAAGSYLVPGTGSGSFGDRWSNEMQGLRRGRAETQAESPIAHNFGTVAPLALAPQALASIPSLSGSMGAAASLPARMAAGTIDAATFNTASAVGGNLDQGAAEAGREAATSPANLVGAALPLAGRVLPAAMNAARGPLARAGAKLSSWAEGAAIRSANADRTAFRKAFKGDPAKVAETGRFLLDSGVPLRSPQAMREGLEDILATEGPKIGSLTDAAGKTGASFDMRAAANRALSDPKIVALQNNTETRPIYDRVRAFLDDQLAQHPGFTPPKIGHEVRQQLDGLSKWEQTKPLEVMNAWRTVRRAVTDELGNTMARAGLDAEWAAANAKFKNASRAEDLARVGAERRAGNRWGSPSEKGAALLGGTSAAMSHPLGLALPAATIAANRFGMPVAARGLDAASRAITMPQLPSSVPVPRGSIQGISNAIRNWDEPDPNELTAATLEALRLRREGR